MWGFEFGEQGQQQTEARWSLLIYAGRLDRRFGSVGWLVCGGGRIHALHRQDHLLRFRFPVHRHKRNFQRTAVAFVPPSFAMRCAEGGDGARQTRALNSNCC